MATVTLIMVGLVSLFVFVLFGALLDLFRDVRQLRDVAGILDRPLTIDIEPLIGAAPSEFGLPAELDFETSALFLLITERCLTCHVLASSLDEELPAGLWVVAETRTAESAEQFVESTNLIEHERVIVDVGGEIASRLGINTAPAGFRIENGRFVSATTVPSTRYLFSILPAPLHLKNGARPYGQRKDTRAYEPAGK